MPLFTTDYRDLADLCPLERIQVIKDDRGEPAIVVIDCKKALEELKLRYQFETISKVGEKLNASNI